MAENISAALSWQLADAVRSMTKDKTEPSTGTATVIGADSSGLVTVLLPGASQPTPVNGDIVASAQPGERVRYEIRNGRLSIVGNSTSPSVGGKYVIQAVAPAERKADEALAEASRARNAADIAEAEAIRAHVAADSAQDSADAAATAAGEAQISAGEAQASADSANAHAVAALNSLATVEDVVDTLAWVTEHGTMAKTTDTSVDPTKVYFVRDVNGDYAVGSYHYSMVQEPSESGLSDYYELSIDKSVQNYIATHLSLTNEGLWLTPTASNAYRVLVATGSGSTYTTAGTYIIDGSGVTVARFTGTGISFARDRTFYIGDSSAYINFDGNGHISIGGSGLTIGGYATDDDVADAAKTATNYITADSTGIKIHATGNSTTYQHQTATTTTYYVSGNKRAEVSTDGLETFDGNYGSEVSTAKFGSTARIGKIGQLQLDLLPGSMKLLNDTSDEIFSVTENASGTTIRGATVATFADSSEVNANAVTVSDALITSDAAVVSIDVDGDIQDLGSTYATAVVTAGSGVSVALTSSGVTYVQSLLDDAGTYGTLSVEYTVSHYDSARLVMDGAIQVDGEGYIVQITNDNWSTNRANTFFKAIANDNGVLFGIGAGGVNRGVYDATNARWLIYADNSRRTIVNGDNFSVSSNAKVTLNAENPSVRMYSTTASTRRGATAPSSNVYFDGLFGFDKNGDRTFYSESGYTTNRDLYRSFVCRRYSSDGSTNYNNGFYLYIGNDGTPRVTFTSGGAAAWRKALGVESGFISTSSGGSDNAPASTYRDHTVTFSFTHASVPNVTASFGGQATSASAYAALSLTVHSVTTTGCKIRVFNSLSTSRDPSINWTAID